jgi:hypothetical protein
VVPQSCKWVVNCMNLIDCMNLWWFNQEFQIMMIKTIKRVSSFKNFQSMVLLVNHKALFWIKHHNVILIYYFAHVQQILLQLKHVQNIGNVFLFHLMASWHECLPFQQYHMITLKIQQSCVTLVKVDSSLVTWSKTHKFKYHWWFSFPSTLAITTTSNSSSTLESFGWSCSEGFMIICVMMFPRFMRSSSDLQMFVHIPGNHSLNVQVSPQ